MHHVAARNLVLARSRIPWGSLLTRFFAGFIAVVVLVSALWPFLPRRYESVATMVVRPTEQDGGSEATPPFRQMLDDEAIQSEIDRISAPELAEQVITRLHLRYDPEFTKGLFGSHSIEGAELLQRLNSHLRVTRDKRSYTLRLGYWAADPVKAAAMTKTLVEVYLQDQLARKRKAIEESTQWLESRTNALRSKLATSEKVANQFLVDSGLIDSGALLSLQSQLATYSSELAGAKTRLIEATTRLHSLQEVNASGALENAPDVLASSSIVHLKEALADARSKTPVFEKELDAIHAEIVSEAKVVLRGAQSDIRNWTDRCTFLRDEIASVRKAMVKRRQDEMRLNELEREVASDRTVLDEAMTRFKNQGGLADGVRPDAEVITAAQTPSAATFPNPILATLGTLLAASLAGVAAAWSPLNRLLRQKSII